jgi:tight adherence protein C
VILALLIGVLLAGAAVALTLRAAAMPRIAAVARVNEIKTYGFNGDADADADDGRHSLIDKAAASIGQSVARHSSRFKETEVRQQLMTAGLYTTAPLTFLGYRVLGAVVTPAALVWLLSSAGSSGLFIFLGCVLGAATGWSLPMSIVRRRGDRRLAQVEHDLPELIDLLVVTVEAGLGFNGSLNVAAKRFHGPLRDELSLTLQEQRLGLPTNDALTNLLNRCPTPSMRSFVRSVLQGETLGVSIGAILRNLAVDMRKRRRQAAEERAQRAPVKMLFPLIFLLLPALFVVLLFPALYTFLESFGG